MAERKFVAAEWKGKREKRKKGWMGRGGRREGAY